MSAKEIPGTVEWFQVVAQRAGVWPDEHAPIGIWRAVQRYYDAMQLPAPSAAQPATRRDAAEAISQALTRVTQREPWIDNKDGQNKPRRAQPEAPAEPSDAEILKHWPKCGLGTTLCAGWEHAPTFARAILAKSKEKAS